MRFFNIKKSVVKPEQQELIINKMQALLDDKNRLLFNAFSLARPELLQKDPPYDWEYLAGVTRAFYKYCDELDAMGKHQFYAG